MNAQQVLILDLDGIRRLTVADFADRRMTEREFIHIAGLAGGYYEYLGKPRATAPHMLLRSGAHSGYYINCSPILAETNICEILAAQMIKYCLDEAGKIDWVVTAALAGIPLGQEIGRQIGARAGFVEEGDDGKLSQWRFQIPAGSRVLLANELITTPGGSAFETKQTVLEKNGEPVEFLPFAALMIDRCSKSGTLTDGTEIRGLCKFNFPTCTAPCPLCAAGSPLVRGKVNWRQLWQEQQAHQREQQGAPNWQAGGQ